ncbi:MAG TPA: DUF885 domain-containing protein [Nocardioidaceae bacterium]|nr:DUF885 domain-containing protein [Nocardioidaceae bacterium]
MTDDVRTIDALSDAFVADYAAMDPISATGMGLPGHEDRLTDLSPEGFDAEEELIRRAYDAVRAATPVDEREREAQEAFLERAGLFLERLEARLPRYQISVISSGVHSIRSVFDLMDTSTEEGWSHVNARLAAVPDALAGLRRTLLEEAGRGNVAAARQIVEVAGQIRGWTGQTTSGPSVFTSLVAEAPEGALKADLERHADAATAALAEMGVFLGDELAGQGAASDAVGRERYALDSRYFLGAEIDLEETYHWGWHELARIEDEMAKVADKIVPGGTVDEAVAALDADPMRNLPSKEAFRDWMQQLADETVRDLADVHFDIPQPVRRIECMIAPTQDGGVYYTGPNEDFSRPGRMWWSVPPENTTFSTWREVTTVYHEGVPGHHLQVGQTAFRNELLNNFLRKMCWVSGSGEGWALYAERLMDDLGYLDDPGNKLGMLDAQAFRAARVVIDIGMHLELEIPQDNPLDFHPGHRWVPDLGFTFLREHTRISNAELRFELNRYLGWPGQAPSYKVGERMWLQARDDAKARKGAAFDLKEFHTTALNLGSIGLAPLTAALARI